MSLYVRVTLVNYRRKEHYFSFKNTGNWWDPHGGSKPWSCLKVKVFLYWPIGVVFGLSTICIIEWNAVATWVDYRFRRSINERLKKQCSKPYSYFTSSGPYYPHTFVAATDYSGLLKLRPPNTNKLRGQQVGEMTNWRAVHRQSVPKTLWEIWTTKHNPVTLPINLYAVGPPDVQPLDLTKLGDHHSVQHMPQKEVTEFLYT